IMNSTPQVETAEISDAELDNVSGGLSVNAVNTLTGAVDGIAPVSGLVDTAVGTVEGVTGLNTAPVTNLAAGLWSPPRADRVPEPFHGSGARRRRARARPHPRPARTRVPFRSRSSASAVRRTVSTGEGRPVQFRQQALAKLQSPEELDLPVRFARPQGWLVLAVTVVAMAAASVWALTGSVASTVTAPAVLTHGRGSYVLQSPVSGQVTEVLVEQGERLAARSPVLKVRTGQGDAVVRSLDAGRV